MNHTPELLTSFGDFQNIYGGYDNLALTSNATDPRNINYMALSVKGFFDNGGSELYVSRVYVPPSATNTGIASAGTTSATTVSVAARFPGAFGNQAVSLAVKAQRAQNVSSLPSGSLLATVPPGGASIAVLEAAAAATDTQITIAPALTGAAPGFVLIDTEVMTVTAVDSTGTKLTVTRGSEGSTGAAHIVGAPVYTPIAESGGSGSGG